MPDMMPSDVLKNFPDIYGYQIKREKEERITIKGIEIKIKRYTTSLKTNGIRVSLIDNTGLFFLKFNEFLVGIAELRPAEERATNMYSFTTMTTSDAGLEVMEGAGFYVYQNHIIFNEEEKSLVPLERLTKFVEYYRKKFNIKTRIKEDEFADLDILERDIE